MPALTNIEPAEDEVIRELTTTLDRVQDFQTDLDRIIVADQPTLAYRKWADTQPDPFIQAVCIES